MSSVNSGTSSSVSSRREMLAQRLTDCAAMVRRAERGPLITSTIQELIEYSERGPKHRAARTHAEQQTHPTNSHNSNIAKPLRPPHLTHVLGKMVGLSGDVTHTPAKSESSKKGTSQKNALRLRSEMNKQHQHGSAGKSTWFGGHEQEAEWCDEHFCMGCACKQRQQPQPKTVTKTVTTTIRSKPAFHRPTNPKSTLIANGWIEQQRPSKMRKVWKEVLASVVEGRKPGEETTLWIQREVHNGTSGKPELEALHQIPVKWLEDVVYHEVEQKFALKVYNLTEEFFFRCPDNTDAAQNWVLTLRSVKEISQRPKQQQRKAKFPKKNGLVEDEKKTDQPQPPSHSPVRAKAVAAAPPDRVSVKELRAIAHGAGISTVGMERGELEAVVAQITNGGIEPSRSTSPTAVPKPPPTVPKPPPPPAATAPPAVPPAATAAACPPRPVSPQHPPDVSQAPSSDSTGSSGRISVKELRAIAHGAGISTVGMERGELERVVARLGQEQKPVDEAAEDEHQRQVEKSRLEEELRRNEEKLRKEKRASEKRFAAEEAEKKRSAEEAELQQKAEEAKAREVADIERKRREEEAAKRMASEQEEARKRQEEAQRQLLAERLKQQQERARMEKEEEERKRLEAERLQREEEEHKKRLAEQQAAELRRQQEEATRQQQQQWQERQKAWQTQQQQQAEALRRQQQAQAQQYAQQQQQYAQQQQAQQQHWQHPQQQQHQWQHAHQQPHTQAHPQWQQQQQHGQHPQQQYPQQQQHPAFAAQTPPRQHPQQQPPQPPPGSSPINQKYAQMAHQTENVNQMSEQGIKHGVLVEWALQPPMLQVLRPIEVLLTTIHSVFPPKFGIPAHDYFSKWKAIEMSEVCAVGALPDDGKLKKTVRKLRFFLHPDKLPRDLTTEQVFVCKLLWDVTNDAWHEHETKKEDLGWING